MQPCTQVTGIKTDYSDVCVILDLTGEEIGHGYWKMNIATLWDINYVKKMDSFLSQEIENLWCLSPQNKWVTLKSVSKKYILEYSKTKSAEKKL